MIDTHLVVMDVLILGYQHIIYTQLVVTDALILGQEALTQLTADTRVRSFAKYASHQAQVLFNLLSCSFIPLSLSLSLTPSLPHSLSPSPLSPSLSLSPSLPLSLSLSLSLSSSLPPRLCAIVDQKTYYRVRVDQHRTYY